MSRAKHGPACQCPPRRPGDGLLDFTVSCEHYAELAAVLARVADAEKPTAMLHVLTTDPAPDGLVPLDSKPCSGDMLCDCRDCDAERARRVRQGVRQVRQPWDVAA